jgi:hypothetical protein
MEIPPMKPWVDVKDADGNSYTISLDEQQKKIKNGSASLYSGEVKTKNGGIITVKIAHAIRSSFSGRFVRITGPSATSPNEIAGQLNRLFAEE